MTPSPTFRVENLGPIRSGEVELRPLTLLIGKNNTGKTYMAQAIHAAHKALDAALPTNVPLLDSTEFELLQTLLRTGEISEFKKSAEDSEPKLLQLQPADVDNPQDIRPIATVLRKAQSWIESYFHDSSLRLPGRVQAYFGVPDSKDVTTWGSNGPLSFTVSTRTQSAETYLFGIPDTPPDPLGYLVNDQELLKNTLRTTDDHVRRSYPNSSLSEDQEYRYERFSRYWSLHLWFRILGKTGFGFSSYYLPSGRSGLLHAWTDVVRMTLQLDRERFGLDRDTDISLSGAALDFISEFQGLFSHRSRIQRQSLAESGDVDSAIHLLEQAIAGSVTIDAESYDIPALIYQQGGNRIPVQRASSMVADLSPLIIWTREIVHPGSLLIVDEPESHLHPEAIRLVARALVRLANTGVKMLCTTHSSILLDQISNCMLSANAPSVDVSLSAEDRIAHSDIGVFRFRREVDEGGVVISPVEIEPDWGIPEEEYADIADDLTNQTAALIDAQRA